MWKMLDKRKNIATLQWGQSLFKGDKISNAKGQLIQKCPFGIFKLKKKKKKNCKDFCSSPSQIKKVV